MIDKRNRPVLIIVALVLIIITAIGVFGLSGSINSFQGVKTSPSSQSSNVGGHGSMPYVAPTPLFLHSIQFVESVVNAKLILPDSTIVGPSFTIVGAEVTEMPTIVNQTETNGTTVKLTNWMVTIFVWDQKFVNGTTMDIFDSGAIAIVEGPAVPGVNSSAWAREITTPGTLCAVNNRTLPATTHCTTVLPTYPPYITIENGLSVAVSSGGNNFLINWLDNRSNIWVNINGPNADKNQLLGLADEMTAAPVAG